MTDPAQPLAPLRRPPHPRPGRRQFVVAVVLLGVLAAVALAFPFVWAAVSGKPLQGGLGRLVGNSNPANNAGAVVFPYGAPGANAATVAEVNWPADKSILGKWNNRTPGQGTIFGYYSTTITGQGYTWSDGLSFPIAPELGGDGARVIIAEWPRGDDPAAPREMHLCTARLARQPNGDIMPQAEGWHGGCILNAEQARWAAANGVPDGLVKAIVAETDSGIRRGQVSPSAPGLNGIDVAKYIPNQNMEDKK